jgi:hypothetical protein
MEPTLHCAQPALGCEAPVADTVVVTCYGGKTPARGDIDAFRTPPEAAVKCGAGISGPSGRAVQHETFGTAGPLALPLSSATRLPRSEESVPEGGGKGTLNLSVDRRRVTMWGRRGAECPRASMSLEVR